MKNLVYVKEICVFWELEALSSVFIDEEERKMSLLATDLL